MILKFTFILFLFLPNAWSFEFIEAPPENWKSEYTIANGIRIHYWRTGGDKPVLIMAHGSSDYGLCWTNIAKELEGEYDILMVDARGHGFTDPPTAKTPADAQAEDIAGLIQSLKLKDPIVMGHSMGSSATAWFAAKYPNMAKAIILEDPRLVARVRKPMSNIQDSAMIQKKLKQIVSKNNANANELAQTCFEKNPQWGKSECDIWAPSKLLHHPNNAYRKRGASPSMTELFSKIKCPTLIIKADASQDEQIKNNEVAKILDHGKIVHIVKAGHNVRRDQKALFLKELNSFLSSL